MKTIIGIMILILAVAGCGATGKIDKGKAEIVAGKIIEIGMSVEEMIDILGAPDSASPGTRDLSAMPEMQYQYGDAVILVRDRKIAEVIR
jgi:hypothetical protein